MVGYVLKGCPTCGYIAKYRKDYADNCPCCLRTGHFYRMGTAGELRKRAGNWMPDYPHVFEKYMEMVKKLEGADNQMPLGI